MQSESNLPRSVWIGGGIAVAFLLVLLGMGIGVGIGLSLRPAPVPVAAADAKPKPPPTPAAELVPVSVPAAKTAAELKPKAEPGAGPKLDRGMLIGKWEGATNTDHEFPLVWEFAASGSGHLGRKLALAATDGKATDFSYMEWRLDGDICNIDQSGTRNPFRVKFEGSNKIVLTPVEPSQFTLGMKTNVLKRFTKEREEFCREKAEERKKTTAS